MTTEFAIAVAGKLDTWVPAHSGTEQPFMIKGRRIQYCFNPGRMEHAYYDLDRDVILSIEESLALLP